MNQTVSVINTAFTAINGAAVLVHVPTGSHFGVWSKVAQEGSLSIGSLSGVVFTGLCNGGSAADHFHRLREEPGSISCTLQSYWMVWHIHTMGEAALHDVANLASLLLWGTSQESR